MSTTTGGGEFGNPLRKFKLVFLGEQSGKCCDMRDVDRETDRPGEKMLQKDTCYQINMQIII